MLAVFDTPARERHVVKLVAANGERVVGASVRRTARLPRVTTDSPRVETAFSQSVDHIEDTVAHHRITPKLVRGREKQLCIAITIGIIPDHLEVDR